MRLTFGQRFQVSLDPYVDSKNSAKVGVRNLEFDQAVKAHKKFPYTENLEMLTDARVDGFDEVIIVNQGGLVCEGAVSNYVFRIDDLWLTPNLDVGILPGIMSEQIIASGLAIEAQILAADLERVTHAFALSSLRIAQPISEIAGRRLREDEISNQWRDKLREILSSHSIG